MSSDLFLDMALKVLPAEPPPAEVSPAALDVVNMFNKQHFVGPGVKIPDGYLDGGRGMHLDAQRHATSGREILWVDRARDAELAADLAFARAAELRAFPPLERIERIAARIHRRDHASRRHGQGAQDRRTARRRIQEPAGADRRLG